MPAPWPLWTLVSWVRRLDLPAGPGSPHPLRGLGQVASTWRTWLWGSLGLPYMGGTKGPWSVPSLCRACLQGW